MRKIWISHVETASRSQENFACFLAQAWHEEQITRRKKASTLHALQTIVNLEREWISISQLIIVFNPLLSLSMPRS